MENRSNWKPLLVAGLKGAQEVLEGSPIPGAGICISVVLAVIEAADVRDGLHTVCIHL